MMRKEEKCPSNQVIDDTPRQKNNSFLIATIQVGKSKTKQGHLVRLKTLNFFDDYRRQGHLNFQKFLSFTSTFFYCGFKKQKPSISVGSFDRW